jgi:AcrR family transcriptional regulator
MRSYEEAAAMELFVECGIDARSIEQVAKRADVAKLTIYRRWTSKEQLVAQAIERFVEERQWPSNAEIENGTPTEIVETLWTHRRTWPPAPSSAPWSPASGVPGSAIRL